MDAVSAVHRDFPREKAIDILRRKLLDIGYLNALAKEQSGEAHLVTVNLIAPIREQDRGRILGRLSI